MSDNRNETATTATAGKGGPSCAVCHHARREEFDKALTLGTMTAADVAREIGCHRSSVTRHRQSHLLPAINEQVQADAELRDVDILSELKTLYRRIKKRLDQADKTDNWQAIRALHSEARQDLELLARLLGELQEAGPTVNFLVMPEWVVLRSRVLTALDPYPDARLAVAAAMQEVGHARK